MTSRNSSVGIQPLSHVLAVMSITVHSAMSVAQVIAALLLPLEPSTIPCISSCKLTCPGTAKLLNLPSMRNFQKQRMLSNQSLLFCFTASLVIRSPAYSHTPSVESFSIAIFPLLCPACHCSSTIHRGSNHLRILKRSVTSVGPLEKHRTNLLGSQFVPFCQLSCRSGQSLLDVQTPVYI